MILDKECFIIFYGFMFLSTDNGIYPSIVPKSRFSCYREQ